MGIFDHQPTLERRNESYNSLQPSLFNNQLTIIKDCLRDNPNQTSRQIADETGIERTSVTRTLASNKKIFNDENEVIDVMTGKRVTLYRLK